MLYRHIIFYTCFAANFISSIYSYTATVEHYIINNTTQKIEITFKLDTNEVLIKDSIQVSVNNPHIHITKPHTNTQAVSYFDPIFKDTKEGYKNTVTFVLEAQKDTNALIQPAMVHMSFTVSPSLQTQEQLIPLTFSAPETQTAIDTNNISQASTASAYKPQQTASCYLQQPSLLGSFIQTTTTSISTTLHSWKNTLTGLFETTGSRWLRLLAALILGILLSLTPCIYPMIPITVGILQSSENKSIIRNFLVALAYTTGISCTFAVLGFLTALGSCVFGQLQSNAWVVLPLIAVLVYLGLAMFGLYEMYIPRFLQPKTNTVKGGSFISAFIFGAVSGTVASPCLSPGLALILAHVAKITQNATIFHYLDGFATLFMFGVGSSLPLLIIGTFSNSITILPRAGMWMVEIKKLLGLMLLGMAFYHLEKFIPWPLLVWFIVLFLFVIGIYYFIDIRAYDSKGTQRYKKIIGTLAIIASCMTAVQGYKTLYPVAETTISFWQTDYNAALAQAQQENKNLVLDFFTPACVACKVLEKNILSKPEVVEVLNNFIAVKIDASSNPAFHKLSTQLSIKGFPTVVILNHHDQTTLKQWIGEVGTTSEFIEALKQYQK